MLAGSEGICFACLGETEPWVYEGNDSGGVLATWEGQKCMGCCRIELSRVILEVTKSITMLPGDQADFHVQLTNTYDTSNTFGGEQALTGKKLDLEDEEDRAAAIKHLFGSLGRFELASWILRRPDTVFYGSLYAEETGKYSSSVFNGGQLEKLVEMGLIERVDPPLAGLPGRTTKYRRLPNALWEIYELGVKIFGDVEAQQQRNLRRSLMGLADRLK